MREKTSYYSGIFGGMIQAVCTSDVTSFIWYRYLPVFL